MNRDDQNAPGPVEKAALVRHETHGEAKAAEMEMRVQAGYAIAHRHPRDPDAVRVAILRECDRPRFAAIAIYARPVGKKKIPGTDRWEDQIATGPSIRFAEEVKRAMGHLDDDSMVTYDDETKRIVRVFVTDKQTNNTTSVDVVVSKTIEKSAKKTSWRDGANGRREKFEIPPLETRTNTSGDPVYIYPATEDEILTKTNALRAKARRNMICELLPREVLDDAKDRIAETMKKEIKDDPNKARKDLIDAFAKVRVMPDMLAEYMGKPIGELVPDELYELRGLYQALTDSEVRWDDALAAKLGKPPSADDDPQAKRAAEAAEKIRANADALKAKSTKKGGAAAPPPEAEKKPRPGVDEPPADYESRG